MSELEERLNKIFDFIETHITENDEYPIDLYNTLEEIKYVIKILKNKRVCLLSLNISSNVNIYNSMNRGLVYDYLTQEEYELLKKDLIYEDNR